MISSGGSTARSGIELPPDDAIDPRYSEPLDGRCVDKTKLNQAMELANLVRISYRDYELCKDYLRAPKKAKAGLSANLLKKNRWIVVGNEIDHKRIKSYTVRDIVDEKSLPSTERHYKIIDTFSYTSYHLWPPFIDFFRDNTSRFGFVAQGFMHGMADESKLYVIIRGTREGAEWINNVQPHQIGLFSIGKEKRSWKKSLSTPEKVHWGFHKIYTAFDPGLFWYKRFSFIVDINAVASCLGNLHRWLVGFRWQGRSKTMANINEELDLKTIATDKCIYAVMKSSLEFVENDSTIKSINISGHSLGAALATIAAYQASISPNSLPISLYTFASPRVGNLAFAQKMKRNSRIECFRIANSEDKVQEVPPSTLVLNGKEMPQSRKLCTIVKCAIGKVVNFVTGNIRYQPFIHVGTPLIFTCNTEGVSSNHNMNSTYSKALEESIRSIDYQAFISETR
jgi:hypothetical protein